MNVLHGYVVNVQAGENLTALDWAYIKISDGRAYKADRADPAKRAMLLITTTTTAGDNTQGYAAGIVTNWGTTLTPGTLYYLSDTAGAMTGTKPISGNYQTLGVALSASELKLEIGPLVVQPLAVTTSLAMSPVSAGSSGYVDITVTGAELGDVVLIEPPYANVVTNVRHHATVISADTVRVTVFNDDSVSFEDNEDSYRFKIFKTQ